MLSCDNRNINAFWSVRQMCGYFLWPIIWISLQLTFYVPYGKSEDTKLFYLDPIVCIFSFLELGTAGSFLVNAIIIFVQLGVPLKYLIPLHAFRKMSGLVFGCLIIENNLFKFKKLVKIWNTYILVFILCT